MAAVRYICKEALNEMAKNLQRTAHDLEILADEVEDGSDLRLTPSEALHAIQEFSAHVVDFCQLAAQLRGVLLTPSPQLEISPAQEPPFYREEVEVLEEGEIAIDEERPVEYTISAAEDDADRPEEFPLDTE